MPKKQQLPENNSFGGLNSADQTSRVGTFPNYTSELFPNSHLLNCLESLSLIQEAIRSGEDIHMTGGKGTSLLHFAAYYAPTEVIRFFVSKGLDVNKVDDEGITPLQVACMVGSLEQVKCLINLGANYNVKDSNGRNLIFFTMFSDHPSGEIISFLINECHLDAEECDRYGMTPIMMHEWHRISSLVLDFTEFMDWFIRNEN